MIPGFVMRNLDWALVVGGSVLHYRGARRAGAFLIGFGIVMAWRRAYHMHKLEQERGLA